MRTTPQELAFALRSPSSGPLAAVVCALADLFEDPSFNHGHRALLSQLLAGEEIPQFLAERAAERLSSYASNLEQLHGAIYSNEPFAELDTEAGVEVARLRRVV